MTLSLLKPISGKLPVDLRKRSSRSEAYLFVLPETKNEEYRTMGF